MTTELLVQLLIKHEDLKLKPYPDTAGKLTIGIGRNLTDNGISRPEALFLCDNDIARVMGELDRHCPWWRTLTESRQMVLADMCFNLGITKLMLFRRTLAAIEAGDYAKAAVEMLRSKWSLDVGKRAIELSAMMKG